YDPRKSPFGGPSYFSTIHYRRAKSENRSFIHAGNLSAFYRQFAAGNRKLYETRIICLRSVPEYRRFPQRQICYGKLNKGQPLSKSKRSGKEKFSSSLYCK